MSMNDRLRELVEPIVARLELELFDLHYAGSTLSILVQRPRGDDASAGEPGAGVDVAAITAVSRAVSRALDDADPIASNYALEVSSPGLERPLRTPAHYAGAVGEKISVKTMAGYQGPRRIAGELIRSDDDEIEVRPAEGDAVSVALVDIERARTVFEWGAQPKPGGATKAKKAPAAGGKKKRPAAKKPAEKIEKKVTTS